MSDEPKATVATHGDTDAGLVARLASQRARFRDAAATSERELKETKKALAALQAQNVELQAKADTSVTSKRVLELEQQVRTMKHDAKFFDLARARGVRPEALQDFRLLCGYKAETDDIDEAAMVAVIDQQKTARAYLFGTQPNGQPPPPPPKPGVASGQGSPEHGAPVMMDSTDPRMNDVKYQYTNFDRISQNALERMQRGEI